MARVLATAFHHLWLVAFLGGNRSGRPRHRRSIDCDYFRYALDRWRVCSAISYYVSLSPCCGRRLGSDFFTPHGTCQCVAYYTHWRWEYWFHLSCRKCHARHRHWRYVRRRGGELRSGYRLFARVYQWFRLCDYGRDLWFCWAVFDHRYFWCDFTAHAKSRRRLWRAERPPISS